MFRRRAALVAGVIALAVAVAGCSAEPEPDASALASWIDAVPTSGGAAGLSGTSATLTFPEPTAVASVELRCTGTDAMSFDLYFETSSTTNGTTRSKGAEVTQDIVCHATGNTPISLPPGLTTLTSLKVSGTSTDAQGAWSAVAQTG